MMSCKEISKQLERKNEKNGLYQWCMTQLHLMMCVHCARYAKQIQLLVQKAPQVLKNKEINDQELKKLNTRILKRLEQHGDERK